MVTFIKNSNNTIYPNDAKICYVSSDGNDNSDGLTKETSFATIQKAVNDGYNYIFVKTGTYAGGISVKGNIHIIIDNKVIANRSTGELIIG